MNVSEELHFLRNEISELKDVLLVIAHNQHDTVATPAIVFDDDDDEVTITCATSGASIHYTTDGSEPDASSDVYSAAIAITEACTVKAVAYKLDMNDSAVVSLAVTPTPAPEGDPEE